MTFARHSTLCKSLAFHLTPCTLYNYTDLLEDYSLDLPSLATTNREMIRIKKLLHNKQFVMLPRNSLALFTNRKFRLS